VTELDSLSASIDERLAEQHSAWTARADQRRELRRELAAARKIGKARYHARRLAAAAANPEEPMVVPTPRQLAEALTDLGHGYEAEVLGMRPDPQLGQHIITMAKRLVDRVQPGDPRLASFARHTDAAGYAWLPETLHDFYAYAAGAHWSFERWLTELAAAIDLLPTPDPASIAGWAAAGDTADRLGRDGFTAAEVIHGDDGRPAGIIATRPQDETR
jgi:hypothetical protein